MLFTLPALSVGNVVARSDELVAGFAKLTSLVLLVLAVVWSVRRLRNAGKSGWWSFAIIPPATILLLGYNFFATSSKENTDTALYVYGIRAKGFWRLSCIIIVSIFLAYLSALYLTFLTDGL
jgi:uncharacterized membrane protein YhaH (DUF805 family)